MKEACLLSILLVLTIQAEYFRLNTNQIRTLNSGDSLISTLANFRAKLVSTPCSLSIQQLQGQVYNKIGNYTPSTVTGNCRNLTISDGTVKTDTNLIFLALNAGLQFNVSTILTIDDWGIIRLIGTYKTASLTDFVSKQVKIQSFKKAVDLILPTTDLSVNFMAMPDPVNNLRKWMFSIMAGALQISQYDDPGIYVSYNFASFTINNSQIYDFNLDFFPAAIFPNITYTPRCLEPRVYLNYKPPFVFVADPYWPIFSLYEQGRYKILQVNLNSIQQTQAWQSYRRLQFRNQPSVCPPYTFEYKGECVTTCPFPYYHQMRSLSGFCVRTCEQYTPKNESERTCNCFPQYESSIVKLKIREQCPAGSLSYPYGCYCNQTGKYFDRTLSWSCVATCPSNTFGSNGLCMECPHNCLTCQIDRLYRSFLECKVCEAGFTMINGKCYRECNPGKGLSLINGQCKSCSDPNCINCTSDVNICKQCSLLYALDANKCVKTCSQNSAVVPIYGFNGVCKPKDALCSNFGIASFKDQLTIKCYICPNQKPYAFNEKCLTSCPSGYIPNKKMTCICGNSSLVMVGSQCLAITFCPLGLGYDPISGGCTLCYYGCLTCYNLACTSCSPGYFLYISPQTVICRRKSPLFPCDQQYSWTQQTCLAIQYANPDLGMDTCLKDIKNCKACVPGVEDPSCALCQPGYLNLNNTCVTSCPAGTLAIDNLACIPYDLQNCQKPYLGLEYQEFKLSYDLLVNSDMYRFYTSEGLEDQNDPVGNIPVYQQMIRRKNDGTFRNSQFFNAKWTCLKCNAGYGLSSDFSKCIPCTSNCATCYMARNDSCIQLKGDQIPSSSNCSNYISKTTGKCVTSCGGASQTPQIINGILYCIPANEAQADSYVRIDSAIYTMPDGKNHIFFVLDDKVTSSSAVTVNLNKVSSQPKLSAGPGGSQLVSAVSQNQADVPISSGTYVYYYDNNPSSPYYLVNFTGKVSSLVTSDNKALPNTIYGSTPSSSHPQFMRTWLAYIGYIMGITIILLQVVYVGNDLLYKADNLVILGQTIYFFSFVHLLVGKLLSQFYYGWIFTHFGFFPNFFEPTIPSSYFQPAAPNSFKLATLDANIVRNAGFAFSLLIVFIGAYAFISISCYIAKNLLQKPDMWHPRIATNSLIGGLEFLSMTIFYWSVANLLYLEGANKYDSTFSTTSKSVSIFFICLITIYTIVRWFFHHIGGLYMAKRILLATTLAASYQNQQMMAPLIIIEVFFAVSRYLMERPQKSRDKYFLILEETMIIGTYLILWLSLDAGVNTIIISIFMFILIVAIAHDLTDVYLESRNEWEVEEEEQTSSEQMAKAEAEHTKKSSAISKMY